MNVHILCILWISLNAYTCIYILHTFMYIYVHVHTWTYVYIKSWTCTYMSVPRSDTYILQFCHIQGGRIPDVQHGTKGGIDRQGYAQNRQFSHKYPTRSLSSSTHDLRQYWAPHGWSATMPVMVADSIRVPCSLTVTEEEVEVAEGAWGAGAVSSPTRSPPI